MHTSQLQFGRPSKIPPLYVAGDYVRVPVSSLRVVQRSQSFYQTLEASAGTTTLARGTYHDVPGRNGSIRDKLERQLGQVTSLLEGLGFVVNRKKSQLRPTQSIQFLGFLVNSQEMLVKLTKEKVAQITTACTRVKQMGSLSIRQLAR